MERRYCVCKQVTATIPPSQPSYRGITDMLDKRRTCKDSVLRESQLSLRQQHLTVYINAGRQDKDCCLTLAHSCIDCRNMEVNTSVEVLRSSCAAAPAGARPCQQAGRETAALMLEHLSINRLDMDRCRCTCSETLQCRSTCRSATLPAGK